MYKAILCLGSNLGVRIAQIQAAKTLLSAKIGKIVEESSYYETQAWGNASAYPHINQCLVLHTKLTPHVLMKALLSIERELGRVREKKPKNGNRLIDIDILFFDELVLNTLKLQLPHPRLHMRRFVLTPLKELMPKYTHPILKKNISELSKMCDDRLEVKKYSQEPFYIAVEGNIGSGKTTLAKALAQRLDAHFLPEQFEDNALLPLFYEKPKVYAFPLEYSFLIQRLQQLHTYFLKCKSSTVADFSLYKCLLFAKANLPTKEFRFYEKHFQAIAQQVPSAHITIVLSTSMAQLKRNIKKRGRTYEQGISEVYLNKVSKLYKSEFTKKYRGKLIHLDMRNYGEGSVNKMVEKVLSHISI
jgi:deoxyguanosine kinase